MDAVFSGEPHRDGTNPTPFFGTVLPCSVAGNPYLAKHLLLSNDLTPSSTQPHPTSSHPGDMASIPTLEHYSLIARRFSTDGEVPVALSIIKLRLPNSIPGPGSLISDSAVSGATSANYHSVIVRSAVINFQKSSIEISVWPLLSFSASLRGASPANAVIWVDGQSQDWKDNHIPFPSIQDPGNLLCPPAAFGRPLSREGYQDRRLSWVAMGQQTFDLPFSKAVSLPLFLLNIAPCLCVAPL